MRKRIGRFQPTLITLASAYADQSDATEELVIPESFDGMEYAAVDALYATAIEQFNELYGATEGTRSEEEISALAALTEGIEALAAELAARDAAAAERDAEAEALAARVQGLRTDSEEGAGDGDSEDADEEQDEDADEDEATDEGAGETQALAADADAETGVTASAPRREVRLPIQRRNPAPAPAANAQASGVRSVVASSGEGTGFAVGSEMDFDDIGRAIDRKLQGFSLSQYDNAKSMGRVLREQHSIATFNRNIPDELTIKSTDQHDVDAVFARAADESRLPQGSLVAAGGWCAPSETLYDLLELESRDGMLSLPEVGVSRGGIRFTRGPSFQDIYSQITGFSFTEENDVEGEYAPGADGNVVGPKPCYHVECTDFEEARLDVDGLCITAGLLMARGYPELISRIVRGAMVAHEHRMNANLISRIVAGSTAINMGNQVGAAAPILDSIEKQVEHYKYTHRLSRSTTLEAVFPFWVRGAIRSDLSRRLGVDLIDVPDARIDAWFRERGISPQFVYNWQAIDTTAASAFNAWPTTVTFLLYAAGTWVRGSSPLITLDTLYDSTLLANNDYTALFTEEGWLVAMRGNDSRAVTVGIEASGPTHMGVDIAHNGTLVDAG